MSSKKWHRAASWASAAIIWGGTALVMAIALRVPDNAAPEVSASELAVRYAKLPVPVDRTPLCEMRVVSKGRSNYASRNFFSPPPPAELIRAYRKVLVADGWRLTETRQKVGGNMLERYCKAGVSLTIDAEKEGQGSWYSLALGWTNVLSFSDFCAGR